VTSRHGDRASALDPVTAMLLRVIPKRNYVDGDIDIARARAVQGALLGVSLYRGAGRASGIVDLTLPGGIRARLYRPRATGPVPTIVFFHGGGWVFGSVPLYDAQCKRLRDDTGAVVLSVEYRLAPEHPYPAAVEDAIAATHWAAKNIARLGGDPDAIGVAGDSAGGNLATVVAIAMRDAGVTLRGQLLIYPATDFVGLRSGEASQRYPSHVTNGTGYFLTLAQMNWFADRYIASEEERANWNASPLRASSLAGVAPAVVTVGGYDPLLDDVRVYANALREAHVPVQYLEYPQLVHGFYALASFSKASRKAAKLVGTAFGNVLRSRNGDPR
jgi:acetyl esterase